MSENIIGGKLKLKGKPLPVVSTIKKKKKKKLEEEKPTSSTSNPPPEFDAEQEIPVDALLTPVQKKFLEIQKQREAQRAAKAAEKTHRQKIEDFNKYLANLSEHYDIPKVGPG